MWPRNLKKKKKDIKLDLNGNVRVSVAIVSFFRLTDEVVSFYTDRVGHRVLPEQVPQSAEQRGVHGTTLRRQGAELWDGGDGGGEVMSVQP